VSGEDIPCAAGVRGDGPCSFELCPPGIGCRRVREQRRQGDGEAALGEEARGRLAAVIFRGDPAFAADADEVLSRIEPVVAALVAQARADGAAEERKRIGREIMLVQNVPPARRLAENAGPHGGVCYEFHPVCARWNAFNEAAAIVRGTS
jgi:hypothetical protein